MHRPSALIRSHAGSLAVGIAVVLVAAWAPGCRGQVRNAERIQTDPFLKYINPERGRLRPERVLDLVQPSGAAELNDLGVAHARRLELDRAEERLNAAIKTRPPLTLPYLNLARLYTICEEPANANRVFLFMAANRSLDGQRLFRLAEGLYDQRREPEALGLMEALVRQERHGPRPADWLGYFFLQQGNLARADVFFSRSLEIRPRGGPGLYGKGLTAYNAGDFRSAAVYLADARKAGHSERDLDLQLADAFFRLGELDESLDVIRSSRNKTDARLVELHGRILLRQNYRADLRSLLGPIQSATERRRLLQSWYGTDQPDELRSLYDEFDLLY